MMNEKKDILNQSEEKCFTDTKENNTKKASRADYYINRNYSKGKIPTKYQLIYRHIRDGE